MFPEVNPVLRMASLIAAAGGKSHKLSLEKGIGARGRRQEEKAGFW